MASAESSDPAKTPARVAPAARAVNRKCRPSGRKNGLMCVRSPAASRVAGSGLPPTAGTWLSPFVPVKMMTSSRFQVPGGACVASQSVVMVPLATSIFFSLPSAKNASQRLSADQNGAEALTVPAAARQTVQQPHP